MLHPTTSSTPHAWAGSMRMPQQHVPVEHLLPLLTTHRRSSHCTQLGSTHAVIAKACRLPEATAGMPMWQYPNHANSSVAAAAAATAAHSCCGCWPRNAQPNEVAKLTTASKKQCRVSSSGVQVHSGGQQWTLPHTGHMQRPPKHTHQHEHQTLTPCTSHRMSLHRAAAPHQTERQQQRKACQADTLGWAPGTPKPAAAKDNTPPQQHDAAVCGQHMRRAGISPAPPCVGMWTLLLTARGQHTAAGPAHSRRSAHSSR